MFGPKLQTSSSDFEASSGDDIASTVIERAKRR